jgi:hypothetical protein
MFISLLINVCHEVILFSETRMTRPTSTPNRTRVSTRLSPLNAHSFILDRRCDIPFRRLLLDAVF